MVIRTDGDLSVECTGKLSLGAQSVEVREGNNPPRKTWKAPTATDQPAPQIQTVNDKITCIVDTVQKMV